MPLDHYNTGDFLNRHPRRARCRWLRARTTSCQAVMVCCFRLSALRAVSPWPINPIALPMAKTGHANGRGTPPARTFAESRVNEIRITAAPATIHAQFRALRRGGFAIVSRRKCQAPARIIAAETSIGAITGATQGTGTMNKMSQVNSEAGQFNSTFKNK